MANIVLPTVTNLPGQSLTFTHLPPPGLYALVQSRSTIPIDIFKVDIYIMRSVELPMSIGHHSCLSSAV